MLQKIHKIQLRTVIFFSLIVFFTFGSVYSGIMLAIETNATKAQQQSVLTQDQTTADVQSSVIRNKTSQLVSDTLYLMDSYRINLANHTDLVHLEAEWLAFSNRKKIYDQIRFIDLDGKERIRVNYSVDGSYLTAEDDLQDKKDRYYFTESIALDDTEVYVSKLDLNIENGEIEQPLKPMLRLGVPCHGSDGELLGVIVINYLADDLLDAIRSAAAGSNGSLFILNSEGYWIVNSADSDTEWAFMYDGAENVTFARRFPEAWDAVRTNSNGYAVTQNGVFIHTDVFLNTALEVENCKYSLVLGDGNLHIVSYIPADSSAGELFYKTWLIEFGEILTDNAFVYLLLLALAAALGLFIGISQSEKKEIRYFSEYDALTGVLNRRAAFQRLNQLSRLAHGEGKPISICFLDINGLKEVNDTLGHDAGDELIVSVADGVKATVRSNDVVARLGGDEFLVAFWDADADRAMRIWERIGSVYRQINETENRAYVVSVSCGIESLSPDSKISVEDALNLADEKMYANKREMKKTLRVVRESEQTH